MGGEGRGGEEEGKGGGRGGEGGTCSKVLGGIDAPDQSSDPLQEVFIRQTLIQLLINRLCSVVPASLFLGWEHKMQFYDTIW